MTVKEYDDLLEQIRTDLTEADCAVELLDAARYNDIDIVRGILAIHPALALIQQEAEPEQPEAETASATETASSNTSATASETATTSATNNNTTTALHYAAANGHVAVVQLLLSCGADPMACNPQKNTPLHWAAANGHLETVRAMLTSTTASVSAAATATATSTSLTSTRTTMEIDVLQRNAAGRSILTEGFSSENHNLTALLLEHDSASEERLVETSTGPGGVKMEDDDDDDNDDDNAKGKDKDKNADPASVVHDLVFGRCTNSNSCTENTDTNTDADTPNKQGRVRIQVREQVMARTSQDSILGQELPDQDATGLGIWAAALVTAAWMVEPDNLERFANQTVLELGAGCGVPGLALAASGGFNSNGASNSSNSSNTGDGEGDPNAATAAATVTATPPPPTKVYLTDFNSRTVENLRFNANLNQEHTNNGATAVDVRFMNWQDATTWPDERLDHVIGSDLIYQSDMVPLLVQTVAGLLKKTESSRFLYVAPDTGRKGQEGLVKALKQAGLELDKERAAPAAYSENPLSSQDEEECFLHFNELHSMRFKLYEFKWQRDYL